MSWYKESQIGGGNEYTSSSDVVVYAPDGYEINVFTTPVPIKFRIDIEARNWGIKELNISPLPQIIEIDYEVKKWETEENTPFREGSFVVDVDKLKRDIVEERGVYTIGNIELHINNDLTINYDHSTVEIDKF